VEGNYSTVDEDMPKTSKNRISMDYSTVELDEHLDTNCSYPENSDQSINTQIYIRYVILVLKKYHIA
jgi:hypothetical protein